MAASSCWSVGPGVVLQQPDVAEDDTPMAYRQTDPAPVHPRLRSGRNPHRAARAGDAEALEPRADRRRGAAGQDRAGADRVQRRRRRARPHCRTRRRRSARSRGSPASPARPGAPRSRRPAPGSRLRGRSSARTSLGHSPAIPRPSYICLRSGARMRDSCRWPTIGGILRFHGGSPCCSRFVGSGLLLVCGGAPCWVP